jgi:hypothetical protein
MLHGLSTHQLEEQVLLSIFIHLESSDFSVDNYRKTYYVRSGHWFKMSIQLILLYCPPCVCVIYWTYDALIEQKTRWYMSSNKAVLCDLYFESFSLDFEICTYLSFNISNRNLWCHHSFIRKEVAWIVGQFCFLGKLSVVLTVFQR